MDLKDILLLLKQLDFMCTTQIRRTSWTSRFCTSCWKSKRQAVAVSCEPLLSHHRDAFRFNEVLTSDKNWVFYDSFKHSKHRLSLIDTICHSTKPPKHPRKIMVCVWWTVCQVVLYEMLLTDQIRLLTYAYSNLKRVQQAF